MTTNAPLIEQSMTDCVMLWESGVPDGLGGEKAIWTPGAAFRAAITKDNTVAARMAEKQGVTERYTVTTAPGAELDFHKVFRRLSDGQVFRVTSNGADSRPPACATFDFKQVTAERWTPPDA